MTPESEEARQAKVVDSTRNDPTRNVLDLVTAADRRQDDLRNAGQAHSREVLELRARLGEKAEECSHELAEIRAKHAEQLRIAESARIDAIRAVDVGAVQRAAEVQATQASALAASVAAAAEAMRTQVAATAEAGSARLTAALEPIQKDIADLRRAQYEAQGQKTQVVETQAGGGQRGMWIGVAFSGFVLLLILIGTAVAVISALP